MRFSSLIVAVSVCAYAESVMPVDKIIKERKPFYPLAGSVEIAIVSHPVDQLKESGVILSKRKEQELADKRTPEEIRKSMAVYKYGIKEQNVNEYVKRKLKAPKRSHVFQPLRTEEAARQAHRQHTLHQNTMLHQLYYGHKGEQ